MSRSARTLLHLALAPRRRSTFPETNGSSFIRPSRATSQSIQTTFPPPPQKHVTQGQKTVITRMTQSFPSPFSTAAASLLLFAPRHIHHTHHVETHAPGRARHDPVKEEEENLAMGQVTRCCGSSRQTFFFFFDGICGLAMRMGGCVARSVGDRIALGPTKCRPMGEI